MPLLVNRLIHVDQLGLFSLIFVDQLGLPRKKIIHKIRSKSNFFYLFLIKTCFLLFRRTTYFRSSSAPTSSTRPVFRDGSTVTAGVSQHIFSTRFYFWKHINSQRTKLNRNYNSLSRKSFITKFQNCKNSAESWSLRFYYEYVWAMQSLKIDFSMAMGSIGFKLRNLTNCVWTGWTV